MDYVTKINKHWFNKKYKQIQNIDYDAVEGFLIIFLLFFVVGFLKIGLSSYEGYESKVITSYKQKSVVYSSSAKTFLLKSGINRLDENRVKDAYSEFKLAYKMYPNDIEINNIIIENLSILCDDDKAYCADLNSAMLASIKN